jgi:Fur family transcriptional regulator, ferric uptake regulator
MASSEHRKTIQELLDKSKGPLNVDEIRGTLGHRSIGQATVYRLLRQGVEDGLYREVSFPDNPKRYELMNTEHRHYFLCHQCDRAFDIQGCLEQVSKLAPTGFEVKDHDILLRGQCLDCIEAKN